MGRWDYLLNGKSLELDSGKCVGCGACIDVCPHDVFTLEDGKAQVARRLSCMECGACALNCPPGALKVEAGVGCAAAIIAGKLKGRAPACSCGEGKGDSCC